MRGDYPRDRLFVSVSQLKTFLRCPRQFELKYVRGVPPAFIPVALAFGSAFHEALAGFYLEAKASGRPLTLDRMLDVFRSAWSREASGPIPLQPDEGVEATLGQLTDQGIGMLRAFHAHGGSLQGDSRVEAVERSFAVDIQDPETGEIQEEQLVGTMDLLIAERGRRVIVEHKSSSRRYSEDQLRYDLQPPAYRLAARQEGLGEVGFRFQVVTKTRVPAVQIADLPADPQEEIDFLRTAGGVLRAIDAGVNYPVRGWACRTCPFQHACLGRRRVAAVSVLPSLSPSGVEGVEGQAEVEARPLRTRPARPPGPRWDRGHPSDR